MKAYWKISVIVGLILTFITLIGTYLMCNGIGGYYTASILIIVCHIIGFVVAIWMVRRRNGGFISFTDALLISIMIIGVSHIVSAIPTALYGKSIPIEKQNKVIDTHIEAALLDNYYSDRDELEYEDQLRVQYGVMYQMDFATSVIGIIGNYIMMAFIGLVVALIMRRDPPDVMYEDTAD